jgi:membrane associated rhomboid family serine protease
MSDADPMGDSTTEDRTFTGLLPDLFRTPVTGLTCAAAIVLTLLWWENIGTDSLALDSRAFEYQPWRLLTSTLLHANAVHLFFNLYWTWKLGRIVESRIGSGTSAGLFLVLTIVPASAEFAVFWGGIGLSGLVYGLFGFLWVRGARDPKWSGIVDRGTILSFVVWFFICIVGTLTQVMLIANVAHAIGLGLGALIGRMASTPAGSRARWIASTAGLIVAIGLAASIGRPLVNHTGGIEHDLAYRGYLALQAEDDARALELIRRALARDDKQSDWWIYLAVAYERMGSDAEAIDAVEHAARLKPDDPTVHGHQAVFKFRLAHKAYEEGRLADAVTLYEASVALDGTDAAAWFNLGVAYEATSRTADAIKAYEKALKLDPKDESARTVLDKLKKFGR